MNIIPAGLVGHISVHEEIKRLTFAQGLREGSLSFSAAGWGGRRERGLLTGIRIMARRPSSPLGRPGRGSPSPIGFWLVLLVGVTGCGGGPTEASPGQNDSPPEDYSNLPSLKFMTYNIYRATHGHDPERLAMVLDVIRAHGPDVVGIQEAFNWHVGTPSVLDSVAGALGMDGAFSLGSDGQDSPNVILSKIPILERDSLMPPTGHLFTKAVVLDSQNEPWIVFVMHLSGASASEEEKALERNYIRDHVVASTDTFAVILGDMNMLPNEARPFLPGWWNVAFNLRHSSIYHQGSVPIDQIWVSGDTARIVGKQIWDLYPQYPALMDQASDHHPAMVELFVR